MIDFTVAYDKLASLETPEDLRGFFQSQGVRGTRGNGKHCPIANWIQMETGGGVFVHSAFYEPGTSISDIASCRVVPKAPFTEAMGLFVGRFDSGDYPELVEGGKIKCSTPR